MLECGENFYKCNVLAFDYNHQYYVIVPSIGGFVWLQYSPKQIELLEVHFQKVTRPCSPTKLYYGGGVNDFRVMMSCFNASAQSDNRSSLYYIDFLYSVTNNTTTFSERLSSPREPIFDPDTVSEAVRAAGLSLHGCFIDEEMYVLDEAYPLHTHTEPSRLDPLFVEEAPLKNCSDYYHIEYNDRGSLIIYCTNQTAVVYNMCTGEASYYAIDTTGIPYSCSRDYTVYRHTDKLVIINTDNSNRTEIEFNNPNIVYGKCIDITGDLYFWGLTDNNTLLRVSVSQQLTAIVVTKLCHLNNTCLRPMFNVQGTVHSYFDPVTLTNKVVNSSNGQGLPVFSLPFHPDMYTIHTSPDTLSCENNPTHAPTTSTNTVNVPQNSSASIISLFIQPILLLALVFIVFNVL